MSHEQNKDLLNALNKRFEDVNIALPLVLRTDMKINQNIHNYVIVTII